VLSPQPVDLASFIDGYTPGSHMVVDFSLGVGVSVAVVKDSNGCSYVYQCHDNNRIREVEELRGIPLKQVICGGWHVLALDSRGAVWSWGDCNGPDVSMNY
jgi:alpha-tubulin suppressor-like RCC1 family protein